MKCKCGKEMKFVSSVDKEAFATIEQEEAYYCENCGRLAQGTSHCISWYEHKLLPKPKIVDLPIEKWCNCKKWRNYYKGFVVESMHDFFNNCPYCGKLFIKTKEI